MSVICKYDWYSMQAQPVIPGTGAYAGDRAGRPTTKPAPPFGERVATLRHERGWTQPELAERLGTTVKMVTYYEREAQNPTHKTIVQFAQVFDVSPAELMGKANGAKRAKAKPGPPSRLLQLTERLSSLPRQKQKVVIEMLESFLPKARG
jgi:transcriptional regulator with XRE-family HTH domain